ncbi:50S ribosomal protein L11 methyltransferase [Candidatus Rariloculus sp.]|uniref:50S ribosomal protein L11 methyltransferase n=1 Tax=Candidatus Rariloculus sp. TaxID=3101265 RepID=UPI003D0F9007
MAWQRFRLRLKAADIPAAEVLLKLAGAQALSLRDTAGAAVHEPASGETPLWPKVELSGLFSTDADLHVLAEMLRGVPISGAGIDIDRLEDEDWQHGARQHIEPRRFGELWLTSADEPDRSLGAHQLRLHMGLAFGTGRHPTTALCLQWLGEHPPRDRKILDYGCGSGVLALAALKLGAARCWAVDNEPLALTATADNARLNGVERELWVGPPDALPDIEVEIVAANILAAPLEGLAGRFADCLVPEGRVVLSGILAAQRERVEACYSPYFRDFSCVACGEWIRLVGTRRG